MLQSLIQRCSDDSVQEFRASAKMRHQEGVILAEQGHHTAAIYLWGYVAEMILKAAYFDLTLSQSDETISKKDLVDALKVAKSLDISIPKKEKWHNLTVWAELLVRYRSELPEEYHYKEPELGDNLTYHARQIYCHWRVILRYRAIIAEQLETDQFQQSIEWFVKNMGII